MANLFPGRNGSKYNKGDHYRSFLPFLEDFIPKHILGDDEALLPDFIKAYFKWLELPGNTLDVLYTLEKIFDSSVGGTSDEFFSLFRKETLPTYPDGLSAARKTVINNIVQLYLRKGTPAALQGLFRIIYNQNAVVTYPDGLLYQSPPATLNSDLVVRLTYSAGVNPAIFSGQTLTGPQGTLKLFSVTAGTIGGFQFAEGVVESSLGMFTPGDAYTITIGTTIYTGIIIPIIGSFNILNNGENYKKGDVIPLATTGVGGVGFAAAVGRVKGGLSSIAVTNSGGGYTTAPSVVIVGDGVDAMATATIDPSSGIVLSISIVDPGENYTKATVFLVNAVGTPKPFSFATAKATIVGEIEEIDILDPGINYTTAPTLNLTTLNDGPLIPPVDANITLAISAFAPVANRNPFRFRGDFTKVTPQTFNILMVLSFGTGNYVDGELVTQVDDTGRRLFAGRVVSWDSFKRELLLEEFPGEPGFGVKMFNNDFPLISASANWLFGGKYSKPFIIDRGDGQIDNEYTYFITSGLAAKTYSKFHKDNTHPAGLNFIGLVSLITGAGGDTPLYLGLYPSGIDFIDPTKVPQPFFREWIIATANKFLIEYSGDRDDEGVIGDADDVILVNQPEKSQTNLIITKRINSISTVVLNLLKIEKNFIIKKSGELPGLIGLYEQEIMEADNQSEDSNVNIRIVKNVAIPELDLPTIINLPEFFLIKKSGEYDLIPMVDPIFSLPMISSSEDSGLNLNIYGNFIEFFGAGLLLASDDAFFAVNDDLDGLQISA